MIDVLTRITEYRIAHNWSEYKLAEVSGLPQSTISSWYRKKMLPSLSSLEKICNAFQISLSQFFDEGNLTVLISVPEQNLLKEWRTLSSEEKKVLQELIRLL